MPSRDQTRLQSLLVPLLGACLTLGLSSTVAAAPPPAMGGGGAGPEEQACAGRSIGDACTLPNRQLGTCGQGTCNRLDYSQGSPPKAVEEACVVCQPGQGHAPPALDSGGAPEDETTPEGAIDVGPKPGSAGSAGSSDKEPPQSASRCGIDSDAGGFTGLFALALLAFARRRRAIP